MESNILTAVFLPIAIIVIMLGMGMALTLSDFRRVVLYPRAVLIGLTAQLLLLPLLGLLIAETFQLSPALAVGLMIVALCPAGPTSNMISFVARGDAALSVTLTALSNTLTVFTIPFFVNFALLHFMGAGQVIQLPLLATIAQIAVLTIIPVAIGMFIRARFPEFATNTGDWVKLASALLLVLVILAAIIRERAILVDSFVAVGPATLALSAVGMLLGWLLAHASRLNRAQRITIPVEVGIQNGTLAIAIASAPFLLNNPEMAITPAIYSLVMFATGGIFGFFVNFRIARRNCACCRDRFVLDMIDIDNLRRAERAARQAAEPLSSVGGSLQQGAS